MRNIHAQQRILRTQNTSSAAIRLTIHSEETNIKIIPHRVIKYYKHIGDVFIKIQIILRVLEIKKGGKRGLFQQERLNCTECEIGMRAAHALGGVM